MEERLSKFIALAGYASRREADRLVQEGHVMVNGTVISEPAHRIDPARDHIKVDGRLITQLTANTYLIVNKPRGVLSARVEGDDDRPTVVSMLRGIKGRIIPVGKLDRDDEGLMLLTTDGVLVQALSDPTAGIPRGYLVKVRGIPDERSLARLRTGVPLEDGRTRPMEVRMISVTNRNAWLQVTLYEGRSHVLQRALFKLRFPVIKLKRTGFGPLSVKGLAPGTFRKLTEEEVKAIKKLAEEPPAMPEPIYDLEQLPPAPPSRPVRKTSRPPSRNTRGTSEEEAPARGGRRGSSPVAGASRKPGPKPGPGGKKPKGARPRG